MLSYDGGAVLLASRLNKAGPFYELHVLSFIALRTGFPYCLKRQASGKMSYTILHLAFTTVESSCLDQLLALV